MKAFLTGNLTLPSMRMIRQLFNVPPKIDVSVEIDRQWGRIKDAMRSPDGKDIAVGVGSRGIANLAEAVRAVVAKLKEAGFKPFIIPAMGSHGGATGDGQISVLEALGVTEKNVGVPVRATMEVVSLGEVNGIPIFLDKLAHRAAGLVLINRIKPHTDFAGPTQSGIIKMMAIGLGNQIGAEHYHRLSVVRNMYEIISNAGKAVMKRAKFLFGVGLVENQIHQTAVLRMMLPDELEAKEIELLEKARIYMPKLPVKEIDLLIIDKMGKDISGAGIDPIVTGRTNCVFMVKRSWPSISRIFVRDLTEASEGNAIGIGQADVTSPRLVDKIDAEATAINCLTSCCPEDGKIPFAFQTDREAIAAALMTLRPYTLDDLRIVHIKSTLELNNLLVSQGCRTYLENESEVYIEPENIELEFDASGNLISLL
ncbi:MAG: DUF2088 domain-containing protein [Desulfobacterales bacterium]|nr:MAG: DUF2088 domain-containing protein [Desulfobacterales bacterium]